MKSLFAVSAALLAFGLSAALTFAWPAGSPTKVLVSGPGLAGEIVITDPALLVGLGPEQFVDFIQGARPPAGLSGGFSVTRYTRFDALSHDEFVDRFVYYPHPAGGRAYVQYLGSEQGGGEAFKNKWFYPTTEGDAAMRKLLKSLGASVGQAQTPLPQAVPGVFIPAELIVLSGAVAIVVTTAFVLLWLGRWLRRSIA